MQARFYLPMYGRFASPDPARDQHFEQTQSWNIYSYCQNNPVTNTDPTGLATDPIQQTANAISDFWRNNITDPLERLQNKLAGNGWTENRYLPNAGEPQVQVPLMFCGGVVPVGMTVPVPGIKIDLPGPSAPAVATNGTAAAVPGAAVTLPVPAVAMTGNGGQTGLSGAEKTPQDRRLTKQEIKQLEKESGQSAHDIKGEMVGNKNVSRYDLFKNKDGEVVVKLKNGKGPGEPTGYVLGR